MSDTLEQNTVKNETKFDPNVKQTSGLDSSISIWLTSELKKNYDLIQKSSGRGFTDYLRNIIAKEIQDAAKLLK